MHTWMRAACRCARQVEARGASKPWERVGAGRQGPGQGEGGRERPMRRPASMGVAWAAHAASCMYTCMRAVTGIWAVGRQRQALALYHSSDVPPSSHPWYQVFEEGSMEARVPLITRCVVTRGRWPTVPLCCAINCTKAGSAAAAACLRPQKHGAGMRAGPPACALVAALPCSFPCSTGAKEGWWSPHCSLLPLSCLSSLPSRPSSFPPLSPPHPPPPPRSTGVEEAGELWVSLRKE